MIYFVPAKVANQKEIGQEGERGKDQVMDIHVHVVPQNQRINILKMFLPPILKMN